MQPLKSKIRGLQQNKRIEIYRKIYVFVIPLGENDKVGADPCHAWRYSSFHLDIQFYFLLAMCLFVELGSFYVSTLSMLFYLLIVSAA